MRKQAVFIFLCLIITYSIYAQDIEPYSKKNEIKLNVGTTAYLFPEIGYEYIINEDMGVGLSAAVAVDTEVWNTRLEVLSFYKIYFGKKPASGFFIETNMGLIGKHEDYVDCSDDGHYNYHNGTFYRLGIGVAVGFKFLAQSGFLGEVYLGMGRIIKKDDFYAYPRLGVTIGKRL